MCGSAFINIKFREMLLERFGKDKLFEEDTLEAAMERFENKIKRDFHGGEAQIFVPLPGMLDSAEQRVRRAKLCLTVKEMVDLFEVAVLPTTILVKAQVSKTGKNVKAVLMVGGFGQNMWLQKKIQEVVGPSVMVLQPPNGETAIVRGALEKGLALCDANLAHIKVESRVARRSYGVKCCPLFDPEKHYASHR